MKLKSYVGAFGKMKFNTIPSCLLLLTFCLTIQFDPTLGEGRIYGGYQIDISKVPYMAAVTAILEQYDDGTALTSSCGGSILKTNLILTAGHCTRNFTTGEDFQEDQFLINVGSNYQTTGGVIHYVKKIYRHPEYKGPETHYHHDVAVLELEDHVKLNAKVKLVTLAEEDDMPAVGDEGLVSGWGDNPEHKNDPRLYQVKLKVISAKRCLQLLGGDTIEDREEHELCADGYEKSFCEGDSGGPFIDIKTKRQIGVVSWGIATCPKSPSIFARVTDNLDFIQKVMNKVAKKCSH